MSESNKTLVLLDAHAIVHRAYHALPDFLSSKGEPTGALYGLCSMLIKIIGELRPDHIAACYDLPQKTFRHEAYEGYKSGRPKIDEALVFQLQGSRRVFEAFGVPVYDSPGFEADDVLGTIVAKVKNDPSKKNIKIIIASGDMDTTQLVYDDRVRVYTLKKGINDTILYDEKKVIERFGFKPAYLPDFKGLRGDPSDNIVGIRGIGEKTATLLIKEFGTIEEIYKNLKLPDAKSRFKKIGISERIFKLLSNNEEEALFSKTLARIRTDAPVDFKLPPRTFWQSVDRKRITELFSSLEFRSLSSRLNSFFGEHSAVNSPGVAGEPAVPEADPKQLEETSIALWLVNSEVPCPSLQNILLFAGTDSFEKAREYIFRKLKEDNLEKVFEEIEKPIISIVKKMTTRGILVDREYLQKLNKEYRGELEKLTGKIYKMAGREFNINSPKQLGEVLFVAMDIKSGRRRTANGSLSTKFSILEELEEDNPIIREILSYRELQKLLSTYISVIPKMAGNDGRLHAKFLQNGASTGRFSSQDPNLQNLPIKTELGRKIRNGFIADKGHKLLALDYSQIELRVAAMLSGDEKMTQIFKEGKDIHAGVASFVFGVPMEKIDAETRRKAKVINFGIIYGMGVSSLRKSLGGTREEAQKFYDNYFRQFSGIKDYLEKVKIFAKENSYTETLFGRRRYFPNINSKISFLRSMAERTAINAPIQGTATADIIKLAIRYADEDLKKANLSEKAHVVLQIHDELVYEVEDEILSKAEKIIKNAMEQVLSRSYLGYKTEIPLVVRSGSGNNFGEVK